MENGWWCTHLVSSSLSVTAVPSTCLQSLNSGLELVAHAPGSSNDFVQLSRDILIVDIVQGPLMQIRYLVDIVVVFSEQVLNGGDLNRSTKEKKNQQKRAPSGMAVRTSA